MQPKESPINDQELQFMQEEIISIFELMKDNKEQLTRGLDKVTLTEIESINCTANYLHNDPQIILKLIRNLLDIIRQGIIDFQIDEETLAYPIGHTYGTFAAVYLNWDLKFLRSDHLPDGELALISKDKHYVIYPSSYIFRLLSDPTTQNDSFQIINKLKEVSKYFDNI